MLALVPFPNRTEPQYNLGEERDASQKGRDKEGVWWKVEKKLYLLGADLWKIIVSSQDSFHMGRKDTAQAVAYKLSQD